MSMSTANSGAILTPAEVDELLIKPALSNSVAAQVSKVIRTNASSLRLPVVNADPSAAWVAEGAEISISDLAVAEVVIPFRKLAGLTALSNELIADSSPEASSQAGAGIARDIARKMDAAFFGTTITDGPDGLGALSGVQGVDAGTDWTNLDPFHEAISRIETVGATVGAFVTSPAVALKLATIKTANGATTDLLQPDPTSPTRRVIAGFPLFVSPAVEANTVWALPFERCVTGMRQEASVTTDASIFFTSDRTAVRGLLRVGFGFPHIEAVVKIATTP